MARQPDIQYVRIYTDGSAARKLELQPEKKKNKVSLPKPKVRRDPRKVVYVDPLSLCAMAAAGLLLVAMAVGMTQLGITNAQVQELEENVSRLESENMQLQEIYESGYDLDEVERQALAMGLIPIEQTKQVVVDVQVPQQEPEPTFWGNVGLFFSELFA